MQREFRLIGATIAGYCLLNSLSVPLAFQGQELVSSQAAYAKSSGGRTAAVHFGVRLRDRAGRLGATTPPEAMAAAACTLAAPPMVLPISTDFGCF
ncbi:MAG: hypothetical protein HC780_22055 [Leptolyngbyaceae cyanobacterium CSU_1_3]|nr:hypothetical protein [Leptolyngbyaceae cyanobacterium CSU_1_3]